jgi:hypothetical protein
MTDSLTVGGKNAFREGRSSGDLEEDPRHCCQIAEISAKRLKYSGRKQIFTARNWSGNSGKVAVLFLKKIY